jgi:hypothetical protein
MGVSEPLSVLSWLGDALRDLLQDDQGDRWRVSCMTEREAKLETGLIANAVIRERAEQLIAAYVEPESDRETIINELIALFDGPQQREAERLTEVALGA